MDESSQPEQVSELPSPSALEQRQQLLSHHVKMVARRLSHALFVFGAQGGLGKSRTILKTLEAEGVEPVLINSHITPLAFFGLLFQYRDDQVIFLDDVDSIFSSMAHLGLLRSALWGTPRIVTYGSSQLPSDLPSRFEITSRFVFAANVIPKKNDAFKAVLSRCDIFELSATNEEVLELMRNISAKGFRGLTPEDCARLSTTSPRTPRTGRFPSGFWGRRSESCNMPERRAWIGGHWSRPSCRRSEGSSLPRSDWTPGCLTCGYCGTPSPSTRIPFRISKPTGAKGPPRAVLRSTGR